MKEIENFSILIGRRFQMFARFDRSELCPAACTDNAHSNLSVAHIVLLLKAYRSILDPYRHSARIIEACDLDYTMLRSAWLNGRDEIDDATTKKASLSRMPPKSYRAKARPLWCSN